MTDLGLQWTINAPRKRTEGAIQGTYHRNKEMPVNDDDGLLLLSGGRITGGV